MFAGVGAGGVRFGCPNDFSVCAIDREERLRAFVGVGCGQIDPFSEDAGCAVAFARDLAEANPGLGCYEIRPLRFFGDNKLAGAPQIMAAE